VLTGQAFSATQYALLASLGNLGRTTLASFSGSLADYLESWPLFFILTAVMVVPSLIMLLSLKGYFTKILAHNESSKQT
jgi:PAT family beta-lactamase induction signal transducer AmpG